MKNLTHSIASKAHKTPNPKYAIVIHSFPLMVIVLWANFRFNNQIVDGKWNEKMKK